MIFFCVPSLDIATILPITQTRTTRVTLHGAFSQSINIQYMVKSCSKISLNSYASIPFTLFPLAWVYFKSTGFISPLDYQINLLIGFLVSSLFPN